MFTHNGTEHAFGQGRATKKPLVVRGIINVMNDIDDDPFEDDDDANGNESEDDGLPELLLTFTIINNTVRWEQGRSDDHTEHAARTFTVRVPVEPVDDVPWKRAAEVISPFVSRVLGGDKATDVKPTDIDDGFYLVAHGALFGHGWVETTAPEPHDTKKFHFEAMVFFVLKPNEAGDRVVSEVRVDFCDPQSDGWLHRFEFYEPV